MKILWTDWIIEGGVPRGTKVMIGLNGFPEKTVVAYQTFPGFPGSGIDTIHSFYQQVQQRFKIFFGITNGFQVHLFRDGQAVVVQSP